MSIISYGWEYDGVDLSTLAYNVRILGDPYQVPQRRGDNVVLPGQDGRLHIAKYLDQRHLTLGMFVRDMPPGGGERSAAQLQANLDTLRGLFARPGLHTLKHQYGPSPSDVRLAQAEVINVVEFKPVAPGSFRFAVTFTFPDPFWYDQEASLVGPTDITTTDQNIGVTNDGTYFALPYITITGQIASPKLSIGDVWVKWDDNVDSGQTLTLDCAAWEAELDGTPRNEAVTHDGATYWLAIPVGVSTLNVKSGSVSGATVQVDWTNRYL